MSSFAQAGAVQAANDEDTLETQGGSKPWQPS